MEEARLPGRPSKSGMRGPAEPQWPPPHHPPEDAPLSEGSPALLENWTPRASVGTLLMAMQKAKRGRGRAPFIGDQQSRHPGPRSHQHGCGVGGAGAQLLPGEDGPSRRGLTLPGATAAPEDRRV